jgi:uroporphyrin-III C-methyltransferase/precorrin-2 dehydrogenase/sirohydrochlorin ferrochelatase
VTTYLPIALNIENRRCLVVGGGAVAERKLHALLEAGAKVSVVAPDLVAGLEALIDLGRIDVVRRPFEPGDVEGAFVVVAATDDPEANAAVAAAARARGILVNAADDPANCDFVTPAVVRRGDVQIAITTGGRSPALARHLRERLERQVPPEYGLLAEALGQVRDDLQRAGARPSADAWQAAISDDLLEALRDQDLAAAVRLLRARLLEHDSLSQEERGHASSPLPLGEAGRSSHERARTGEGGPGAADEKPPVGQVILVGAGPGDPGLLTLAGRAALTRADVVVYDRLVNPALLEITPPGARMIYAGKSRGGGPMSQEEINALVCSEAQRGSVVVRLKGGDPFVFGRGGEEALAAARAGVPFRVVPGVSAAVAAPAYAGVPVTHRGLASTLTILTGHEQPGKPAGSVDWDTLARLGGTLVLLMGVDTLRPICRRLVRGGLAPETPAAIIQCGTTPDQRVVTGTVANIAARAQAARIRPPATTVIGEVAALASQLSWWDGVDG